MNDEYEYRLVSTDKTTGTTSRWGWDTKDKADTLMALAKRMFPRSIYNIQSRRKVKQYKPKYKRAW